MMPHVQDCKTSESGERHQAVTRMRGRRSGTVKIRNESTAQREDTTAPSKTQLAKDDGFNQAARACLLSVMRPRSRASQSGISYAP